MTQEILKHGVLDEKGFLYTQTDTSGRTIWAFTGDTIHTMKHVGDVYELALQCGVQRVWIHTSNETYNNLPDDFISTACEDYHTGDSDINKYAYFEVYKLHTSEYSQIVGIHFARHPRNLNDYGIPEYATAKDVYTAIAYVESLVNIPLTYSTGHVGQELLIQSHRGAREVQLQPCTSDMTIFIKSTGASRPFHRALTPEEESMLYLHSIDKNANFLGASGIQLGIGDYTRVEKPVFSKNDVGLWDVSISGSSLYEGVDMPSAATLLLEGKKRGYMYTSTCSLLLELGYSLEFHEVMIWDKDHRGPVLSQWQKLLSNAYTELRVNTAKYRNPIARTIAQKMVRGMYVKGLSWLSMDKKEDTSLIDRPDWYHLVIAEAYQKMIRNIISWHRYGMRPLLMNNDELIYASNEKDITKALPGIRMEQKPSHYKLQYTIPVEEAKHLFTPRNSNAVIRNNLKTIARTYGYSI